ncbi:MAG: maleylacetoacetate isomerase [Archangium sp.]|nr:maleylacetoacetate isomerase [Archangium sp.]
MKLFNYWRSSASYRVRLALHFKGLSFEYAPVNLVKGEQHQAEHIARNPWHSVPVLQLDDGTLIPQSVAIVEYLEEKHPTPALFPRDLVARARMRAMVETVNSGIQPLHNLQVLNYVKDELKGDTKAWSEKWIGQGLDALEAMAKTSSGKFMVGDAFTFADACLLPQLFGARRFASVDAARYPTLIRVEAECMKLDFVQKARPEAQPDAVPA